LDEDTVTNDWLGATLTIPYTELVHSLEPIQHDLEILDKKANKIGNVNLTTRYIWAEPPALDNSPSKTMMRDGTMSPVSNEAL
jgi:hypothetical protein